MTLTLYPTRIEAVDDGRKLVFRMESFDRERCELKLYAALTSANLETIVQAIREAVAMLEAAEK